MEAVKGATREVKAKVCLVGEEQVGKTSLIRRFVYDEFDERYRTTIGAKVSRKNVAVQGHDGDRISLCLAIWDIMGNDGVRELMKDAFFNRARGLLAVCDATRPDTLDALDEWIETVHRVAGDVAILILANKVDLGDQVQLTEERLAAAGPRFGARVLTTSAKTGENVSQAFLRLGRMILL